MSRLPTHYDTLQLPAAASADEIRDAYRALSGAAPPGRDPDEPGADDAMAEIDAAYEVLSDPERRREYDLSLQELRDDGEETSAPAHRDKQPPAPRDDEADQRAANREFVTRVTHISIVVILFAALVIYSINECRHDAYCRMHGHWRTRFF